jgi:hypothetical protein
MALRRSSYPPRVAQDHATAQETLVFAISEACLRQIEATIGSLRPENGIVLGGDRKDGIIRHVYFDRSAKRSGVTYSPDFDAVNGLLSEWWNRADINLLGFAHSHPGSFAHPSTGDLVYAKAILGANPALPRLALPIVTVEGGFKCHPFYAERTAEGVACTPAELQVLREELVSPPVKPQVPAPSPRHSRLARVLPRLLPRPWWEGATFARVQDAYDLPRLARSRVVVVGVGGAMQWVEELARCGLGQFVLIDPDTVSLPNIGTQQCYQDEVGFPKVDVLAARVRRINPRASVIARHAVLDRFSDDEMTRLAGLRDKRKPLVTVLAAMTDNFEAQARVNRLALHLGLPSIAGQLYAEGRGVEVTWTYPGVSRTCHRCVLRPRFRAYLEEGFQNDVTSHGTPIFSTTRLTSLKGFIALALLHHGSAHPRWGEMLQRIGQRTLVQARLDPDVNLPAFRDFSLVECAFCDESAWLEISSPRSDSGPICPDCDGLGADPSLIGRDGDTRLLRRERR